MKYFSTFSGIGGFEKGIHNVIPNAECIGFSEIDKHAKAIYQYHYPNHTDYGDITAINVRQLPDFNLLVGGFPCQAFSIAGKRQGFKDTRGTLFFDVARILKAKQPEWVLLENVKGLLSHEGGKTLGTILGVLTELGYSVGWEVVNSCHFGVPQNRERIFIVGHLTKAGGRTREVFPVRENDQLSATKNESGKRLSQAELSTTVRDGIGSKADGTFIVNNRGTTEERDISTCLDANYYKGIDNHAQRTMVSSGTWRTHNDEPSFTLTSQDKHGVQIDHSIRRLTPVECERLQAFPDNWTAKGIIDGEEVEISDTQRYKTLGNSVTTSVIQAIMTKLISI